MIYKIRKNNHFSLHMPKLYFGKNVIGFKFEFDENCLYDPEIIGDHINKLYGVSWGLHHKNSFRIGWMGNKDKISLYAYYYNNCKREIVHLVDIKTAQDGICIIKFDYKYNKIKGYITTAYDYKDINVDFEFPKFKFGYYLFPYFGGIPKAPHTMNMLVQNC